MIKYKLGQKSDKIYILPNLITYLNMFFGLMAIFISMDQDIKSIRLGAILILFSSLTDKLDGFVARKLEMTSDFGKELDSLCDLVSFAIAPVIVGWNKGLFRLGSSYIVGSVSFIGAGIFRLARYNLEEDQDHITGLPITLAGGVLALKYLLDLRLSKGLLASPDLNLYLMNFLSLLMVLKFKIKKPRIIDEDLF